MASFSPVELDFDEMHVKITLKNGEKKIFKDESLASVAVQEWETVEDFSEEPVCGAVLLLNRICSRTSRHCNSCSCPAAFGQILTSF